MTKRAEEAVWAVESSPRVPHEELSGRFAPRRKETQKEHRSFGTIIETRGRFKVRYTGPGRKLHRAGITFTTRERAQGWLSEERKLIELHLPEAKEQAHHGQGIRRLHGAPPDQAAPLIPPELWHVLDACPPQRTWADRRRPPDPSLAGARDRCLLLVGFVAALRRSELAALTLDQIQPHPNGYLLALPRSKTNQRGDHDELVILPRAGDPRHCPVTAIDHWLGPLLRPVSKGNRATARPLSPASITTLVQAAITRAGIDPTGYSGHSLRAGFVTYAHLRGASDRAIAHQTRHRSLATIGTYTRIESAWTDNAATVLGL